MTNLDILSFNSIPTTTHSYFTHSHELLQGVFNVQERDILPREAPSYILLLGRGYLIGPQQQQSDTSLERVVFQSWDTMSYFYPHVAILYVHIHCIYIFVLMRMDTVVNEYETSLCHCNWWVMRIKVLVLSYLDSLIFKCWKLSVLII